MTNLTSILPFLLFVGCGTPTLAPPPSMLTVTRTVSPLPVEMYPYCDEPVQPCPCEDGYTCVRTDDRDWCLPVWEADCQPRCIPRTHPWIVCQGNAEVHGIAEGPPVAWMAVKAETLAGCALGNGWTWRVWV